MSTFPPQTRVEKIVFLSGNVDACEWGIDRRKRIRNQMPLLNDAGVAMQAGRQSGREGRRMDPWLPDVTVNKLARKIVSFCGESEMSRDDIVELSIWQSFLPGPNRVLQLARNYQSMQCNSTRPFPINRLFKHIAKHQTHSWWRN
jgi:hypothetical protein